MKSESYPILILLLLLLASPAWGDMIVTLHDSSEIKTESIEYDGESAKLADGSVVERNRIRKITIIHKKEEKIPTRAELPEDVSELLKSAEEAERKFPGAKMLLLVDYGYEEKRENGTWLFRYRTAAKIMHPDMLSMAARGLFYEDEREKAMIVQARSIDPDGTVHEYDQNTVKISEPSRDEVSFGRGKQMTYQIPNVKVGSIVDYTHEWEVFNPYDHEMFFPSWNFAGTEPFINSKLEIVVPKDSRLYWTVRNMTEEETKPDIYHGKGTTTYIWEMKNQPGLTEEPNMPPVGEVVPHLECSPFSDWSYIKRWSSERLVPRMQPTGEMKKLVKELTEGLKLPEEKIAVIYHYIQRYIQYISIKGSIASGLCGHPASETLENKYGDCIDSAILFSAMLRIAGIEAYPVWVSTNDTADVPTDIPTLGGNHAITEIHLKDSVLYLDSTATNYRYPAFRWDDHGIHAINPILARVNFIQVPEPSMEMIRNEYEMDLSGTGDAKVNYLSLRTGSWEAGARGFFLRANEEEKLKTMNSIINSYSPGARLLDHELKNARDLSKQFEWHMKFEMPGYAQLAGSLMIVKIPGLSYNFTEVALEQRSYDLDYKTSDAVEHKITINIPEGYKLKYHPPDFEISTEYASYKASFKEENNRLVFEDSFRRQARFVPVADYSEYREMLQKIGRYSKEHIFFERESG